MRRAAPIAGAAAIAVATWWALPAAPRGAPAAVGPAGDPAPRLRAGVVARVLADHEAAQPRGREPGAPPASLRDTAVDGAVAAGPDGRLIVGPELRRFFEYFFAASGEEPDERIRARIAAAIGARLDGAAARDAQRMLDRFCDYRAGAERLAGTMPADDLGARVAALRTLRTDVFGAAAAEALFADEWAATDAAVAERRLRADPALSDADREDALAALAAALPASVRTTREAVTAPLRLARDEAALRAAGGTAAELAALREQAVGPPAARRLAELDARRALWQARVEAYRAERAAVDTARLDPDARAAAVAALRARHFHGSELLRIEALDRLAAAEPAPPGR